MTNLQRLTNHEGHSTHDPKSTQAFGQSQNIGPDTSRSNSEQIIEKRPKKKANFDEIYVTVLTTLDLSKHTAVTSLSTILKARRYARKKPKKQNPVYIPQL